MDDGIDPEQIIEELKKIIRQIKPEKKLIESNDEEKLPNSTPT